MSDFADETRGADAAPHPHTITDDWRPSPYRGELRQGELARVVMTAMVVRSRRATRPSFT
jgi:hypothetical protein